MYLKRKKKGRKYQEKQTEVGNDTSVRTNPTTQAANVTWLVTFPSYQ